MRVEDRQQRHPDAGLRRRRENALRHLGDVSVWRPVGVVMQIVELADAGEAGFQHLRVELRRDRLDIVGRDRERDAIHHLAPGPEIVRAGAAIFRKPRHGALKSVAVEVRHAGDADRMALVVGLGRSVGVDRSDAAAVDPKADIVRQPSGSSAVPK